MVSFFVGAALIAALVDIPIFARVTVYPTSQLDAALVLVRLLVALPVGALAGGFLVRRLPPGLVAAAGMALAAGGFGWMSTWGLTSLSHPVATVPLVLTGLGFGLALAPVNAALLAATEDAVHGVTSALLVVARMVGMLVGISALTTIGLRRYYAVQVDLPARPRCARRAPSARRTPRCSRRPGWPSCRRCSSARRCARWSPALLALVLLRPGTVPRRHCPLPCGVTDAFEDLLAANRDSPPTSSGGFDGIAHAGVAVVTCMDSRIDPLRMLGLKPGDAKIFRNPGGRVTPLRSRRWCSACTC